MRPCDRCGKPIENIEIHCDKCTAYLQTTAPDYRQTKVDVPSDSPVPHDWSMDLMVLVACGSATLGGALIGWLEYGLSGLVAGAIGGLMLAAVVTRFMIV